MRAPLPTSRPLLYSDEARPPQGRPLGVQGVLRPKVSAVDLRSYYYGVRCRAAIAAESINVDAERLS
jgi:hypothetical protein